MKRLSKKEELSFTFDHRKNPVLTVQQGEAFLVETENNTVGKIKTEKDLPTMENLKPYSDFEPRKLNPVSGPIYIEGAERGDILAIAVKQVVPSDTGVTFIHEGFGPLANLKKWPECGENFTKVIKHIPGPSGTTRDGRAIYNNKFSWDLAPFIGTIGVAPDFEIHSSLVAQLPCGGNWDCRDIKEGSTLYLNCYHKGALLFLGDVHGSQGDTEWCGTANEVQAEVTFFSRTSR